MNLNEKKNELLDSVDNAYNFIGILLAMDLEYSDSTADFQNFLIELSSDPNVDLLFLSGKAIEDGQDVFRVMSLLRESCHKINIRNPKHLLDLLSSFNSKIDQSDFASGIFFPAMRALGESRPEISSKIFDTIVTEKNSELFGYLISIILGIIQFDFEVGYQKALILWKNEDIRLRGTAIRLFGLLEKIPPNIESEMLTAMEEAFLSPEVILQSNVTFAAARLSSGYPTLMQIFITQSAKNIPEIQVEVANFIFSKNGDLDENLSQCLINISNYDLKWQGISDIFDLILYRLIEDKKYETVNLALRSWITGHSSEDHRDFRFEKIFDSFCSALVKDQALFSDIIVNWLNQDDLRFHHCLEEILSFVDSRKTKPPEILEVQLREFDMKDCIYIIRKVLGYVYHFEHSANIIFSFLKHPSLSEKLHPIVVDVFFEYLGNDYVGSTVKFLELRKSAPQSTNFEKSVAEEIIDKIEKKNKLLNSLPRVPELMPRQDLQIRIDRASQKKFSDSFKNMKGSFLFSMVKNVAIKEAKKWFSYRHGSYSEISTMSHFSESIELPKSEVLDSVGAMMQRSMFRRAKRGEV